MVFRLQNCKQISVVSLFYLFKLFPCLRYDFPSFPWVSWMSLVHNLLVERLLFPWFSTLLFHRKWIFRLVVLLFTLATCLMIHLLNFSNMPTMSYSVSLFPNMLTSHISSAVLGDSRNIQIFSSTFGLILNTSGRSEYAFTRFLPIFVQGAFGSWCCLLSHNRICDVLYYHYCPLAMVFS